ncbi:Endocytosis and vacuole integrity protein [Neophaeococcomyces mojaviensis]|uniref:Endocytosis and vacuole integrity protein n=1 Tax=Neophaeococcomyces mojaviensis TaxID=3383035 RepID=A0ACC2ZW75_9EURO|nr:Endocytosis and vacuole integrity protein [Knufia sp. JES_112]
MTAAFLQSELVSLISDSKRKNNDVRTAAERSLTDLKAISVTSETQLAGDLIRKSHFIDPFLLACKSQNVKLASSGAASLQRLVASTAIPRSRLPDILQSFEEAVSLALEVQLKILQTLPFLLQLYAEDLHGEAMSRTLGVSADLSSSKMSMVSSTAGATFQQLVAAVFERAANTKTASRQDDEDHDNKAKDREDALAVFIDLCALLTERQTRFARLENLPPASVLETLESLLASHGDFVLRYPGAHKACESSLIPGLSALIENSASFGIVARAFRILFTLTSQHLGSLKTSIAEALKIILKISDRVDNHKWRRILGLEFFRGLCSDYDALSNVFAAYDLDDGGPDIVSGLMASLVRTASEDPSLIGLGRQSTIPTSMNADSSGETAGTADVPGSGMAVGSVAQATNATTGISAEWSTMPTPCLDQFDRSAPPEVPVTYVYTLVLGCTSAFSDGLSKFVMPLSMPKRKLPSKIEDLEADEMSEGEPKRRSSIRNALGSQKYQQLVNPLTRQDLGQRPDIENCAKMIEACWPAILASCSTFLNAALDSYFYHILVRTVQKLTQVSGVLELFTPRDALLTTLAKVSVPANVSTLMNALYGTKLALQPEANDEQETHDVSKKPPVQNTPRQSVDLIPQTLNVRNLLCLRALLNLGIALGPTLSESAWTIVFQSLSQVEALMSVGTTARSVQTSTTASDTNDGPAPTTLAGEFSAVDVARKRMIESTKTYSDSALKSVCKALFEMIEDVMPAQSVDSVGKNGRLRPKAPIHRSTRSVSGNWAKTATLDIEVQFVLKSIGRLASVNLYRFENDGSAAASWDLIVAPLLRLQSNSRLQQHSRLQAATIIDGIVVESSRSQSTEGLDAEESMLLRYGIPAFGKQLENITARTAISSIGVELEIIQLMLGALENVVGSRGESLKSGWNGVFQILGSVVDKGGLRYKAQGPEYSLSSAEARMKLYPAAFKVVQLIVSDFLSTLEDQSMSALFDLFEAFGSQDTDLNMSLTTIALFWNAITLILSRCDRLSEITIPSDPERSSSISNLWQVGLVDLSGLCKDNRSDARTAAMRMLSKVIEASISKMPSETFNSCFSMIFLPLLDFYSERCSSQDDTWRQSTLNLIEDLTKHIQGNATLLIEAEGFPKTWLQLIQVFTHLLKTGNMRTLSTTFSSLSDMIVAFRQSESGAKFSGNEKLLRATWSLWRDLYPASLEVETPNQEALAAHAGLLVELTAGNLERIAGYKDAVNDIMTFITKSVYEARHERYTMDVNRVSPDQERILQILGILQRLMRENKMDYAQYLLYIIRKLVVETNRDPPQAGAMAFRKPTGIAFATACIGNLRILIQAASTAEDFIKNIPAKAIIDLSATSAGTKYSHLPFNPSKPLWQVASLLGSECLTAFRSHCIESPHQQFSDIGDSINAFLTSVLSTPHLEALPPDNRPSSEKIRIDTDFDILRLHEVHAASHMILTHYRTSELTLRQYILTLFHHCLVARPWYDDLPQDVTNNPLENFTTLRRGSVRRPDLPIRTRIYSEALKTLLSLVSSSLTDKHSGNSSDQNLTLRLATLAAPYTLLRLVLPLKTFLADQPLRYLTPPPAALLADLNMTLNTYLSLRTLDSVFMPCAEALGCNTATTIQVDGKSHLRIMYSFIQRFSDFWHKLPRLKKGHAWQDRPDGQGVEAALKRWREVVAEGWGPLSHPEQE